jgi:(p)ppGpp synthase/HD superfamily hydrolase
MHSQPVATRPPGYALFFIPLAIHLSPKWLERVQFAYFLSKFGHALRTREDGSRYFDHPKSVGWIGINELGCLDPRFIIIALLHDIGEETYLLSPYRVSLNFGEDIALDVSAITKLPKGKETTEEYLGRIIARGPCTILAKLCDRLHNLRTLEACSEEKQRDQIEETRSYHLPLLIPALRSHGDKWTEYADMLEEKILSAITAYETL